MPILAVAVALEIAAGLVLSGRTTVMESGVLLAMIPVVNGLGGNIGTILASRLSSGLHIGSVQPKLGDRVMMRDLKHTMMLAVIVFAFIALAFNIATLVMDMGDGLGPGPLTLILLGAGMIQTSTIIVLSIVLSITSFKRGIDPDNVVIPMITTSGDVVGILAVVVMAMVIGA